MMGTTYCVYKHTAPNGKVYIGITGQNPIKRWNNGRGYIGNEYFYRAIKKYGWDNFEHSILFCNLTKAEACKKEVELIAQYKSNIPLYGYNHSKGGDKTTLGYKLSAQTREKISKAAKGRQSPNKGKFGSRNHGSKTIEQYTTENQFVKCYAAIGEAARETGICHADISKCCNGKRKMAGGYVWKFKNPNCI